MEVSLKRSQADAVSRMNDGCILNGGVGTGKSRTSLAYFACQNGGELYMDRCGDPEGANGVLLDDFAPSYDLYIITTAQKRDRHEWEKELSNYMLTTHDDARYFKSSKCIVDSWNNIGKYSKVSGAFFIFDEQRVVGKGSWVKSFLKIVKANRWILLSATPGDKWEDYVPVFIANGFFKNRSEFNRDHVVFSPFTTFPKIERYLGTRRLMRLRDKILVSMDSEIKTVKHNEKVLVDYDVRLYKDTIRSRWNPYDNEPIENASSYCYVLRKITNSDESRQVMLLSLHEKHSKMIVFYNFDYELEILRNICEGNKIPFGEWNGHKHQDIPEGNNWMYLVQYTAGAEGWNCTITNCIVFYSRNYSYKILTQSMGRIDRMDTLYKDLYYYHLYSKSSIDLAIGRALDSKKKFNESKFYVK